MSSALVFATEISHYARRLLDAEPVLGEQVAAELGRPLDLSTLGRFWALHGADVGPETLSRRLRTLKKQVALTLMARDLAGLAQLDEVVSGISAIAEFAIRTALTTLETELVAQHGQPIGEESGEPQTLIVVAMGKLGGGELNVSSDIDLIFVYPEAGETNGPRRLSNQEFFTRLGQRLIRALNDVTEDGYVFRVDMRLRPHGDAGPLVVSFAMLENYLIAQGREWERYAWMKAKAITGDADGLMELVRPFVYRKYLDYGAYSAIRDLHAQIRREVARRDKADDVKLGPGGIREIEFVAQIFQLIRGGRTPRLQLRSTRETLAEIGRLGLLSPDAVAELLAAYDFLRRLEHRLQYLDDQQTQMLPSDPDARSRVARAMNCPNWEALRTALDHHRARVTRHFEHVFVAPSEDAGHPLDPVWQDAEQTDSVADALANLGYHDPAGTAQRLAQLRRGARYQQLSSGSRKRFDSLVPPLLAVSAEQRHPDVTLLRLLDLLEAVGRRESYLALMAEHPQVLQRLATLYAASPWVSEYLTRHPILLDELLDARVLYTPPERDSLTAELDAALAEVAGDTEQLMNTLRHFHHTQVFRLVAQDLAGMHTIEALGDHLSDLADVLLAATLRLCWQDIRNRHTDQPRFAVIGYGKLGGKELGYATDLDIIFLYDDDHPDAPENYARLAKRLSTWLSTPTPGGIVYELDLRLRPNGESGLLVSSIDAFSRYQMESAWVWEHQALTRARFVAGDPAIGQRFDDIKLAVLARPRDTAALKQEVLAMRQKMRDAKHAHVGSFDVKHDAGGLVDVEFCVQYLVLAFAHDHPVLTRNSGNIALLKAAGDLGLIPANVANAARSAYRELRRQQHQLRLAGQDNNRVPDGQREDERDAVLALWNAVFGS